MKNSFLDNVAINNLVIKRICEEELSEQENAILNKWLATGDNRTLYSELLNEQVLAEKLMQAHQIDVKGDLKLLMNRIEKPKLIDIRRRTWWRYAAAAVLVLVIGSAAYLLFYNKEQETGTPEQPIASVTNDLPPGSYKARLTLADGSTIVLDSATGGTLAQQGTTQILNKEGKLVYEGQGKSEDEVYYNVLTTSRGQMYPLFLSDNSKVWINSASSIKFPVRFAGAERRVEITGEAYFEIAHNASKPFIVSVNGVEIKVLGTKFNVNSYTNDGPIKTTLIEGAVQVKKGIHRTVISPGEQAQVEDNRINVKTGVDTDKELAWKNGLFFFKKERLKSIMPQIERWYDVDVKYEGSVQDKLISGKIDRNVNLSEMLKIFSLLKIDYRIEGRRLILKGQ